MLDSAGRRRNWVFPGRGLESVRITDASALAAPSMGKGWGGGENHQTFRLWLHPALAFHHKANLSTHLSEERRTAKINVGATNPLVLRRPEGASKDAPASSTGRAWPGRRRPSGEMRPTRAPRIPGASFEGPSGHLRTRVIMAAPGCGHTLAHEGGGNAYGQRRRFAPMLARAERSPQRTARNRAASDASA